MKDKVHTKGVTDKSRGNKYVKTYPTLFSANMHMKMCIFSKYENKYIRFTTV